MLTSIYYLPFLKACKEIIAKTNTSSRIRTRISQAIRASVLSIRPLWYLYLFISKSVLISYVECLITALEKDVQLTYKCYCEECHYMLCWSNSRKIRVWITAKVKLLNCLSII